MPTTDITTQVATIMQAGAVGIIHTATRIDSLQHMKNLDKRREAMHADVLAARATVEEFIENHPEASVINPLEGSYDLIVQGSEKFFTELLTDAAKLNIRSVSANTPSWVASDT